MLGRGLKSSIIALESNLKMRILFVLMTFGLLVALFLEVLIYQHSIELEKYRYNNFTDDILIVSIPYNADNPYTFSSIYDKKLASIENVIYTQYAISEHYINKGFYQLHVRIKGTSGNFIGNVDCVDFNYQRNSLINVKQNQLKVGRIWSNEEYQEGLAVGIIYESTALRLFGTIDIIDTRLNLGTHTFKIIGILKDTNDIKDYNRNENNNNLQLVVYTPITYIKGEPLINYSILRSYDNTTLKEIIFDNISEKAEFVERRTVIEEVTNIKKTQLDNFYYVIIITYIICILGVFQLIKNFINQMTFECSIRRTFGALKSDIFSLLIFQISFMFFLALIFSIVTSVLLLYIYFYFNYKYTFPFLSYLDITSILLIGSSLLVLSIMFTTLLSLKVLNTNIIDGVKGNS